MLEEVRPKTGGLNNHARGPDADSDLHPDDAQGLLSYLERESVMENAVNRLDHLVVGTKKAVLSAAGKVKVFLSKVPDQSKKATYEVVTKAKTVSEKVVPTKVTFTFSPRSLLTGKLKRISVTLKYAAPIRVVIYALERAIEAWSSGYKVRDLMKMAVKDWRNTPRRIVWFLFEASKVALVMTLLVSLSNLIKFAIIAWISSWVIAGVVYVYQSVRYSNDCANANWGDGKMEFSELKYKISFVPRMIGRALFAVVYTIPAAIQDYRPIWFQKVIAPLYLNYLDPDVARVQVVEEVVPEDINTESANDKVTVLDTAQTDTTASSSKEPVTEPVVVTVSLDGDEASKNPSKYGRELFEQVDTWEDVSEQKRFRKELPGHLRRLGLTSSEVTIVLQGFDASLRAAV